MHFKHRKFVAGLFIFLCIFIIATLAHLNKDSINIDCHQQDFQCFSDNLINILNTHGIKSSLRSLELFHEKGMLSSDQCHQLAHKLGRYAASNRGVFEAASHSTHLCRAGYIHGIFENVVYSKNSKDWGIVELCSSIRFSSTADRFQCLHGLGHGLTAAEKYNISTSLKRCSQLKQGDTKICATGAYMEAFGPSMEVEPADKQFENVFDFCNENDFKTECYLYVGISLLRRNNNSFADSVEKCNDAPEEFKESCKRGLGVLAARKNDYNPARVFHSCFTVNECWFGSASEYGQSLEINKGARFCKQLPSTERIRCLGEIWWSFSKHI